MPADRNQPLPAVARIGACDFDFARREVTRAGDIRTLEPRVFATLVYLLERRGQIVPRLQIIAACWGDAARSESALSRAVMKLRRLLGESANGEPLIRTVYGIGYQMAVEAQPCAACIAALPEPPGMDPAMCLTIEGGGIDRLVLLPVVNRTSDRSCGWAELGLVSMMAAELRSLEETSVVPMRDTLAAVGGLRAGASPQDMLRAMEASLGRLPCMWSELHGGRGRYEFHFTLSSNDVALHAGTLFGSDPTRLAVDAASSLRRWLRVRRARAWGGELGDLTAAVPQAPDAVQPGRAKLAPPAEERPAAARERRRAPSDPFLREVLARALRCNADGRIEEALHLLEVLLEHGARGADVVLQTAAARISLADVGAERSLRELDAVVAFVPEASVLRKSLTGVFLEQQGRLRESVEATLAGLQLAEQYGLADLKVRMMVDCASRMAMAADDRADAMLSQATAHARRLGNRLTLCDAYCAAARVAGFRNDWNTALQHQQVAVGIAEKLPQPRRAWAHGGLSWVQGEFGELYEAVRYAGSGLRASLLAGVQPQLGLAAGQAALAYIACRQVGELVDLHRLLATRARDESISMWIAREAYVRATLLERADRHDEAIAIYDQALERANGHPRLMGRCLVLKLRVLLRARRLEEFEATVAAIRREAHAAQNRRLLLNLGHALACRDHLAFGRTEQALNQLHRLNRTAEVSEIHAITTFDAAWIHLERGEVAPARQLVTPLRTWREQSPMGLLVTARLRHESGDWAGAARMQRAFNERFADSASGFHARLLETYRRADATRQAVPIERLDEPMSQHWVVAAPLVDGLGQATPTGLTRPFRIA